MDITNKSEVMRTLLKNLPDVVIHLAAMTDVDKCEIEKARAKKVNVHGTSNLIEACKKISAKIIYLSTDFVFDGKRGYYEEKDDTNPLSYYAKTKLWGEIIVEKSELDYLILRPSVLYGYNDILGRGFVNWVINNLIEREEIRVVIDQVYTPTLIDDIANGIEVLLNRGCSGIYHLAGPQKLSRYEMALIIAKTFNFENSLIHPITASELKQKAIRPIDSSLNIEKIKREGIYMHNFIDGLKIMKKQMGI